MVTTTPSNCVSYSTTIYCNFVLTRGTLKCHLLPSFMAFRKKLGSFINISVMEFNILRIISIPLLVLSIYCLFAVFLHSAQHFLPTKITLHLHVQVFVKIYISFVNPPKHNDKDSVSYRYSIYSVSWS